MNMGGNIKPRCLTFNFLLQFTFPHDDEVRRWVIPDDSGDGFKQIAMTFNGSQVGNYSYQACVCAQAKLLAKSVVTQTAACTKRRLIGEGLADSQTVLDNNEFL